jgi:hypothetical protein
MDETPICERANAACKLFEVLVVVCPASDESRKAKAVNAEDQLARFKIWAGNIGIDAEGHASLDYRLRDSSQARALMLDLLESLQSHLQRGELHKVPRTSYYRILMPIQQLSLAGRPMITPSRESRV